MPDFPIIIPRVFDDERLAEVDYVMRRAKIDRVKMGLGDYLYGAYTPPYIKQELTDLASKVVGRDLVSNISFIRLNHKTTDTSPRIHADSKAMGEIDVASVFYLDTNDTHGTALFTHRTLGPICPADGQPVFKDDTDWEPYFFYTAKRNSMLLYAANMYHSRWPIISYGDSQINGRLIIVNFMRYK